MAIAHLAVPGQTINSISRSVLNEKLVEEALLAPNIRFFFEHKPQMVDFHHRVMNVHDVLAGTTKQVEFDLCIGADGSHSFVRRQIMRVTRYVSSATSSTTLLVSRLREPSE